MSIVTLNDRGVRSVTTFGSINTGNMVFIKKLTASSSGTLDFVNGTSDVVLDSTYKEYLFTFNNIHPATDGAFFQFQGSTNTGSSYGVTLTTTKFDAYHNEAGNDTILYYYTSHDLAQSTNFQHLNSYLGTDNDQSGSGSLHLFNPSSTTFVKHFMARVNYYYESGGASMEDYTAGYVNSTSDVDAIQFTFNSGNIDAGTIKLYGIKDS